MGKDVSYCNLIQFIDYSYCLPKNCLLFLYCIPFSIFVVSSLMIVLLFQFCFKSLFKGIVHPINQKFCWKCTHFRASQNVDDCFFIRFGERHHLLSNGSPAVNGCRQNEIKPSQQSTTWLHSSEVQSCVFVISKSIINMFFTSYSCFKIWFYNIAFSSEKAIWSEYGEKYAQINEWERSKTVLKKCWWILMWDDNRG